MASSVKPVVVIVGGGSSGWSAAALLSASPSLDIKVIEPVQNNPIGVGESTLPVINTFHEGTELKALKGRKWLDQVDGTAKFSIQFEDFYKLDGRKWVHPFFVTPGPDVEVVEKLQAGKAESAANLRQADWVEKNLLLGKMQAEKFWEGPDISALPTGFHFDAALYGAYLRDAVLTERPHVKLIKGAVTDVTRDESDKILTLGLNTGDQVSGDYFVDCTGFKSLLSTGGSIDYTDRLYCDTALAAQLPYIDKELQQRNTTHCKALSAGWVWNVPLQSRIGTGYVYSSRHMNQAEAEQEFRAYLEQRFGYPPSEVSLRRVDFTPRRKVEPWRDNVISIGLSGFFLEPLESTGIALTHLAIQRLRPLLEQTMLPLHKRRAKFNQCVNARADEAMEFIDAHYALSERQDSQFWRDARSGRLSEAQQGIFSGYVAENVDFDDSTVRDAVGTFMFFPAGSWALLMYGYGFQPNSSAALTSFVDARRNICASCPHKRTILNQGYCAECNCIVALKTKLKSAACPIGKW